MDLYDTEPPDEYIWGLEELFGLIAGAVAAAVVVTVWTAKRFRH